MTHTEMALGDGDAISCQAIIGSIEKHWKNSDQAPLIAAIILNPLLRTTPFCPHSSLTLASVHQLLQSLFTQFYPNEEQPHLFIEISEYLEGRGSFSPMETVIDDAKKSRVSDVGIYCGHALSHTHIG